MSTFYTDHWKEIEPERIERYEQMFQFRADQEPLLEALNLGTAGRVLDFGCGPGFLAEAIASRTPGEVIGADLNAEFVERATARKQADNLSFLHINGDSLVSQAGRVDRLLCKNVLEYVPDVEATLQSFLDVLEPGGEVLISDSDWGFLLVEPWGKQQTEAVFEAAAGAFNERFIGRKLPGLLTRLGFADVHVSVSAGVDRQGRIKGVLLNMMSYIQQFGSMPEEQIARLIADLDRGVEDGTYMFILPQFLVSARRPA
jgi:SAM-dependent methyltransferase